MSMVARSAGIVESRQQFHRSCFTSVNENNTEAWTLRFQRLVAEHLWRQHDRSARVNFGVACLGEGMLRISPIDLIPSIIVAESFPLIFRITVFGHIVALE